MKKAFFVDATEMAQIKSDKKLLAKLKVGHSDVKKLKGKVAPNGKRTD